GMIVVYAVLVLVLNLLGDLMLALVDPRVRLS
ncbi:MAG: ABC transporter, partial [Phenylobacterium sp.]|nr:ABC transporter [Phenylobacterium sp.]